MTLQARVDAYAAMFAAKYPDSVPAVSPSGRWLTAMWLLGNDYRGSGYYGAYPPAYLKRLWALFPEVPLDRWLHLFSGSLKNVRGVRVDMNALGAVPTVRADARALPFKSSSFPICAADPPYTPLDAAKYQTPPVNKPLVLHEVARVVESGGSLAWLDTMLPMYSKSEWHHWGLIGIQRSTNHRTRLCSLFTRL